MTLKKINALIKQLNINIINMRNEILTEKNSTSLVWIIWLLIICFSQLWASNINLQDVKSNILEHEKIAKVSNINYLEIWKQVVIIWWKEYLIEISPKY